MQTHLEDSPGVQRVHIGLVLDSVRLKDGIQTNGSKGDGEDVQKEVNHFALGTCNGE